MISALFVAFITCFLIVRLLSSYYKEVKRFPTLYEITRASYFSVFLYILIGNVPNILAFLPQAFSHANTNDRYLLDRIPYYIMILSYSMIFFITYNQQQYHDEYKPVSFADLDLRSSLLDESYNSSKLVSAVHEEEERRRGENSSLAFTIDRSRDTSSF
jgi:hypothetical protein